jgi:chromosome segregation ATPase
VTGVIGFGLVAGGLLAGLLAPAWAEGIYTCVDATGRRITSDRPIIACIDREQRELTPSGTLKRKIGPSLTADERAAEEEKQRKAVEERNQVLEEKRRERALLTRYPDKVAHDKERNAALAQADGMIDSVNQHTEELIKDRKRLDLELEFFKNDPSKVPPKLKRQIEENVDSIEAQKRFVRAQQEKKRRINVRFDEELGKLRQLWAQRATPVAASAPASTAAKQP